MVFLYFFFEKVDFENNQQIDKKKHEKLPSMLELTVKTYHCDFNNYETISSYVYSKTCVKRPLKNRRNKDLNDKRQLNEDRK